MSFLIRKGGGGGPTRGPPSRLGSSVSSQRRNGGSSNTTGKMGRFSTSEASRGGGRMQQQLQQHRRPQQKQQEKHKAAQGVISMDEVMADLEVLAQQQRESQLKLELTKTTKQQKLQQRSTLENKLADLKYADGQKRAQLLRARNVLSRSTRELGAVRLLAGRAGDDLKAFDKRLKRAFLCNRNLQVSRRKVDSNLMVLRSKLSIASRLKAEAIDKVRAVQRERDDVRQEEESLRRTIQEHMRHASQLVEETTNTRSEISVLEQDLAAAQQNESAAKLRLEGVAVDMEAEDKRHKEAMESMHGILKKCHDQQAKADEQRKATQGDFERKKVHLAELWKRYVKYQQHQGMEVSPEPPQDGSPLPVLDLDNLRTKLRTGETALQKERSDRDGLRKKVEKQKEELDRLESETAAATEAATKTRSTAMAAKEVEMTRRETSEKILRAFEKEKSEVLELRRSVAQLMASRDQQHQSIEERCTNKAEEIEKLNVEVEEEKDRIASEEKSISILRAEMEQDAIEHAERIACTKKAAADAKAAVEEGRDELGILKNRLSTKMTIEMEHHRRTHSMMLEDSRDDLIQLLTDYPELDDVEIVYDATQTAEEQARIVLASIRDGCEKRIKEARKRRDRLTHHIEDKKRVRKAVQGEEGLQTESKRARKSHERGETKKGDLKKRKTSTLSQLVGSDEEDDDHPFWNDQEPATQMTQASQKSVRWEDSNAGTIAEESNSVKSHSTRVDNSKKSKQARSKTYGRRDLQTTGGRAPSSKSSRKEVSSILKTKDRAHKSESEGMSSTNRRSSGASVPKRSADSAESAERISSKRLKTEQSSRSQSSRSDGCTKGTSSHKRGASASKQVAKKPSNEDRGSSKTAHRKMESSQSRSKTESSESERRKSSGKPSSSLSRSKEKLETSVAGSKPSSSKTTTGSRSDSAKSSYSSAKKTSSKTTVALPLSKRNDSRSKTPKVSKKPSGQTSGISSMEGATKTVPGVSRHRRRKKKNGQAPSKPKNGFHLESVEDFDFHF